MTKHYTAEEDPTLRYWSVKSSRSGS